VTNTKAQNNNRKWTGRATEHRFRVFDQVRRRRLLVQQSDTWDFPILTECGIFPGNLASEHENNATTATLPSFRIAASSGWCAAGSGELELEEK
jgi:hypothetical protein